MKCKDRKDDFAGACLRVCSYFHNFVQIKRTLNSAHTKKKQADTGFTANED